jgi:hypothetical protein
MNRRLAGALIAAILVLGGAAILYIGRARGGEGSEPPVPTTLAVETVEKAELPSQTLYFPDELGTLTPVERPLAMAASPEQRARVLLEAVLAGPVEPGLAPPLPAGTTLGAIYLSPGAVLYVDLVSGEHSRPPAQGSLEEMLSVYSLVDTVLLNVPEIEAMVLLWNGRQPQAFAGHVDTSLPLRADRDLIAARR